MSEKENVSTAAAERAAKAMMALLAIVVTGVTLLLTSLLADWAWGILTGTPIDQVYWKTVAAMTVGNVAFFLAKSGKELTDALISD